MFQTGLVESRKGARPGPTGSRWFPFPAHQTGRAHFEHPAFRQTSSIRLSEMDDMTAIEEHHAEVPMHHGAWK